MAMKDLKIHSIEEVETARRQLGDKVRRTPVWQWKGNVKNEIFGAKTEFFLKLELFQFGGSFKIRGSLMNMVALSDEQLQCGVTAVSAGNHAISVAYAAKSLDAVAKVVMPKSANTAKIKRCESLGAEIEFVEDVHKAFKRVKEIEKREGKYFIHPFESRKTVLGAATVGFELARQVKNLDAVIVPVGGGGLIAGIASCMKQINPDLTVYGVEPEGADTMSRSFKSGKPEVIAQVNTIADSLGSPHAAPYTFGLAHQFVDRMVTISDGEMTNSMQLLFDEMKLAVEPAGASATAALRYKLLKELRGKDVGIIVCGSNIDLQTYYANITSQ